MRVALGRFRISCRNLGAIGDEVGDLFCIFGKKEGRPPSPVDDIEVGAGLRKWRYGLAYISTHKWSYS